VNNEGINNCTYRQTLLSWSSFGGWDGRGVWQW